MKEETFEQKLLSNITYYPTFQNVRDILQELRLISAPAEEYEKVFLYATVKGYHNGTGIKYYLIRATLSKTNAVRPGYISHL